MIFYVVSRGGWLDSFEELVLFHDLVGCAFGIFWVATVGGRINQTVDIR